MHDTAFGEKNLLIDASVVRSIILIIIIIIVIVVIPPSPPSSSSPSSSSSVAVVAYADGDVAPASAPPAALQRGGAPAAAPGWPMAPWLMMADPFLAGDWPEEVSGGLFSSSATARTRACGCGRCRKSTRGWPESATRT